MTELYLLRHAESQVSQEVDRKNWSLTEEGALHAMNVTPLLASLMSDYIYSSPYLHCRETVTPYAKASSKIINVHQGLKEVDVASEFVEDFETLYRNAWQNLDLPLSTGESFREGQNRALTTLRNIAESHKNKRILISTHGTFIGLVLQTMIPSFGAEDTLKLKSPDLVHLKFNEGYFSLGEKPQLALESTIPAHAANLAASFSMFNTLTDKNFSTT